MASSLKARSAGFFLLRSPLLPFGAFAALRDPRALFANDELVREALFIASPELHDALVASDDPPPALRRALVRYLSRMATRATPFGLMAGVTRGEIAAATSLDVSRASLRRHVRLDHGYAMRIRERAQDAPLVPNETLYEHAGQLRYIERRIENDAYAYHLAALDADEPLRATLALARDGATRGQLARALEDDAACAYVDELIAQDVLRDASEPPVTGRAAPALHVTDYRVLAATLPGGERALRAGALVQVDTAFDAPVTLSQRLVDQLAGAADVLHRLFGAARDEELDAFRERFRARYDRREVPLLAALDPDAGVSFGGDAPAAAPLIDGLAFPDITQHTHVRTPLDELLLRLVASGAGEVELTRADIDALALPAPRPLPATYALFGAVLSDSTTLLEHVTGASGARLLGRFCSVLPSLESDVRELLRAESYDHCVVAEVVHVPEGRLGNVVARPVFFDYEIELAGRSGAPPECRLPLSDLRIALVGEEIVLRSASLDRRVIPRVTTAHNYESRANLPLYRLLAKLQGHGEAASLSWSWRMLERAPRLPRVRFGGCVLSRARWTISSRDVEDPARRGLLPRFVEHERLALDLANPLCVDELRRIARRGGDVVLRELLVPAFDRANEVIVPMINLAPRERARPRPAQTDTLRRTFAPGSAWTYLKIYSGTSAADALLTDVVAPLARERAGRWFFARYADPDPHLRVRLHGNGARLMRAFSDALAPFADAGVVHRLQFDTYEREIERYGGSEAIEHAEALFHADSEAAVELTALPLDPDQRWRAVLASMHALLAQLTDEETRRTAVREMRASFANEFGVDSTVRRTIGQRFRQTAPDLVLNDEAVQAIFRRRARHIHEPLLSLRNLGEDGRLTVTWDRFVISAVHMCANRLLSTEQRVHEVVLYDFLERLYAREHSRNYAVDA